MTKRFWLNWEKWKSSQQWWEQERRGLLSFDYVECRCHRRVKKDAGQEKPLDLAVERT